MLKKAVLFLFFIGLTITVIWHFFVYIDKVSNNSTSFISIVENKNEFIAEGGKCIECHAQVVGLGEVHSQIGCTACHFGNNMASTKEEAHNGMVTIPGNVADMNQSCGVCHSEAVKNMRSSMMSTNNGIVAVDKYIFGEVDSPDGFEHIAEIGHSAADEHLRNLCSRCHLGYEKEHTGPINELSRGGGCNACHLIYSDAGKKSHFSYGKDKRNLPQIHPSLNLNITNEHCFGCHSRSGRISTNYEGFHETLASKDTMVGVDGYRILQDDRVFKYVREDVHHTKGLLCIDCHTYADVMGDGNQYAHEEDAVKINCEDCHTSDLINRVEVNNLDLTNKRIYNLRAYIHSLMLTTKKDNIPLLNTVIKENNEAVLLSKRNNEEHPLLAPSSSCSREFGHKELACATCHTNWAPQCIGCHVDYDSKAKGYDLLDKKHKKGSWIEYAGEFLVGEPTLAVSEKAGEREIQTAVPGMIFTLDQSGFDEKNGVATTFHRLFAPASPHTTAAKGRDCKSCHNSPVALGYGRGKLEFIPTKNNPHWTFEAEYANLPQDGLPSDAWIGFMEEAGTNTSTRLTFRAFSIKEQQKILRVGACLTCHEQSSDMMQQSVHQDFNDLLGQVTDKCRVLVIN